MARWQGWRSIFKSSLALREAVRYGGGALQNREFDHCSGAGLFDSRMDMTTRPISQVFGAFKELTGMFNRKAVDA
jgi:hypothetical protein